MRIRRLKKLVRALEALPDDIKNMKASENVNLPLDRDSDFRFDSFAGLISIVADDIPALKKHYAREDEYDYNGGIILNPFSDYTTLWEWALRRYLGVKLEDWVSVNSELWGNDETIKPPRLYREGFASLAFDMKGSEVLTNRHIINHLICVLNRYKSLSLKDKVVLFINNKGGFKIVFILLLASAYMTLIIYANMFPFNSLDFMTIWLSITAITTIWNY